MLNFIGFGTMNKVNYVRYNHSSLNQAYIVTPKAVYGYLVTSETPADMDISQSVIIDNKLEIRSPGRNTLSAAVLLAGTFIIARVPQDLDQSIMYHNTEYTKISGVNHLRDYIMNVIEDTYLKLYINPGDGPVCTFGKSTNSDVQRELLKRDYIKLKQTLADYQQRLLRLPCDVSVLQVRLNETQCIPGHIDDVIATL